MDPGRELELAWQFGRRVSILRRRLLFIEASCDVMVVVNGKNDDRECRRCRDSRFQSLGVAPRERPCPTVPPCAAAESWGQQGVGTRVMSPVNLEPLRLRTTLLIRKLKADHG